SVPALTKESELAILPGFQLPPGLEAREPPETRGVGRDGVRLLISHYESDQLAHTIFRGLPDYLVPGDLLVVNTSGTLKASLPIQRADGANLRLHLSTHLPDGHWLVEPREPSGPASLPFSGMRAGEQLVLPGGATATLLRPHGDQSAAPRLWEADLSLPQPLHQYLRRHGSPIRYGYISRPWPIRYYQTVYAAEPGSAEMPSAGRAFTGKLIATLVGMGITIVPLILHTGVASQERDEPPYEEYYRVSETT